VPEQIADIFCAQLFLSSPSSVLLPYINVFKVPNSSVQPDAPMHEANNVSQLHDISKKLLCQSNSSSKMK